MRASLLFVVASLIGRAAVAQVHQVVVRDAGPGPIGRYLQEVLAAPATRVLRGDSLEILRDSVFPGSVVVLARQVTFTGEIRGDLVVVGGDLVIKPGAKIYGRAIAIGGAAHRSLLAAVSEGRESYRDFTFDATEVGGTTELRYRSLIVVHEESAFQLPFPFGLRLPTYDRSNGLSLPVGPTLALNDGQLVLDGTATYRSQLGRIDPLVRATWRAGRKYSLDGRIGRETRTNDAWIASDLSNSVNVLLVGRDTRNWYRASIAEASAHRRFETPSMISTAHLGGRIERARAVRPGPIPTSGPWSFFGRKSEKGIYRPNPQIPGGDISSVLAGSTHQWIAQDFRANLDLGIEVPLSAPGDARFVQATIDGQVGFPTFRNHRYRFDAHAIVTQGDIAPQQRWGYLGGPGTLSTLDTLLGLGGDQLLFLESRYIIPISRVTLPKVGSPTLTFRHILGSAGVDHLPSLTQIVGVRLSVTLFRVELLMDTAERKPEFHASLSLTR